MVILLVAIVLASAIALIQGYLNSQKNDGFRLAGRLAELVEIESCSSGWYITGYSTPVEAEFVGDSMVVNVTNWEKDEVVPRSLRTSFLESVEMEGWGKTLEGDYIGFWDGKYHGPSPFPLDSLGNELSLGRIAVDRSLVPHATNVIIPTLPSPWNETIFLASDVGQSVVGKKIDVYTGEGSAADAESHRITSTANLVCSVFKIENVAQNSDPNCQTVDNESMLGDYRIKTIGTPKQDGRNWFLRIDCLGDLLRASGDRVNPSRDSRIQFEASKVTLMQENNTKFLRLDRADPGTDPSHPDSNKVRLYVFSHERGDANPEEILYDWRTGAAEKGYMRFNDDIRAAEYTLIARAYVLDGGDAVSLVAGGAGHYDGCGIGCGANAHASSYISNFQYNGSSTSRQFAAEFDHGSYEWYDAIPLNEYGSLHSKWIGYKVISMPNTDNSTRVVHMYINESPIDPATGEPSNDGWKPYATWEQTHYKGQAVPHTWGGAVDFWRLDWILFADISHASIVEITAIPIPS
jgi:hypothetical protein